MKIKGIAYETKYFIYLIRPRSSLEHVCRLAFDLLKAVSEGCTRREEGHVDADAEVDDLQRRFRLLEHRRGTRHSRIYDCSEKI